MSRTVHHVRLKRRRGRAEGYWSSHQIEDLRYSAAVLAEAERTARRPLPEWSVQSRVFDRWPRATNDPEYGYFARIGKRQRRCHDRTALRRLVMELDGVARRSGALSAAELNANTGAVRTIPTRSTSCFTRGTMIPRCGFRPGLRS